MTWTCCLILHDSIHKGLLARMSRGHIVYGISQSHTVIRVLCICVFTVVRSYNCRLTQVNSRWVTLNENGRQSEFLINFLIINCWMIADGCTLYVYFFDFSIKFSVRKKAKLHVIIQWISFFCHIIYSRFLLLAFDTKCSLFFYWEWASVEMFLSFLLFII